MDNAKQVQFWNGEAGERWVRLQAELDRALEPFGDAVQRRANLRVGDRVVDVGCGCGSLTLAVARSIGDSGLVIGIDVSSLMLARAKERAAAFQNISLVHADASSYQFERSADAVVSRFGVMFFHDPNVAFANLRTALRPGGRLAFACWCTQEENPWLCIPRDAALQHVPPPLPAGPEEPGPFSLADRIRVERILRAAGFAEIKVDAFEAPVLMSADGVDAAVDFATATGVVARVLADADDGANARVRRAVREALTPHLRGQTVSLLGAAWLVSATNAEVRAR